MKKRICCLLTIAFTVAFCELLIAQTPSSSSTVPSPVLTSATPNPSPVSDEVVALRAQLEVMKQYDQRLLDTVYWALGTLGTLALLVVGLGWYTNFRIYKRDVEDLKREVKQDIEGLKKELQPELMKAAREAGESAVKSSLREIKELQFKQLKLEAEKWEKDGYKANALHTYSEMIDLANAIHSGLYVPEILDKMVRLLSGKEFPLWASTIADVTKELEKVPEKYSATIDEIKQLMRDPKFKQTRA